MLCCHFNFFQISTVSLWINLPKGDVAPSKKHRLQLFNSYHGNVDFRKAFLSLICRLWLYIDHKIWKRFLYNAVFSCASTGSRLATDFMTFMTFFFNLLTFSITDGINEKPLLFFFSVFVVFDVAGLSVKLLQEIQPVLAVNISTRNKISRVHPSAMSPYPWASNGELKSISADIGSEAGVTPWTGRQSATWRQTTFHT